VNIFADEETKKCHEWAKHGVEGTHFTGNDSQKLDKDVQDKRVKKKVAKVMSALHGWSDVAVDPVMFPAMEVANFPEEVKELELEPEILPDNIRHLAISGKRANAPRAKPLKPSVPRCQGRKALQDLSTNTLSERKGLQDMPNSLIEESILKERSALWIHKVTQNPLKLFTVEETRKCHEWAKDVIEGSHFTGNDPQKLDKDVQGERDKAQLAEESSTDGMTSTHFWTTILLSLSCKMGQGSRTCERIDESMPALTESYAFAELYAACSVALYVV